MDQRANSSRAGLTTDVLLAFYQEIGEHLRAGGDLRERLSNLYFTILAAAITGFVLFKMQPHAAIVAGIGPALVLSCFLGIFGELVLWGIVAMRMWQAEYVNCLIIIQAMIRSGDLVPSAALVCPQFRHPYLPGGTTSRTFLLVQTGVLFALYACVSLATTWMPEQTWTWRTLGWFIAAVMLIGNMVAMRRFLASAERRFWLNPASSWCFAGFIDPLRASGD